MCRPVTCRLCSKRTWAGCGAHVDQVMAGVPADQRCACTPADHAAAATERSSLLSRIFGR